MYRETNKQLNAKVIEACLERDAFLNSANLLGIARGDKVFFANMDETNVLTDFAHNDFKVKGKSAIQTYREKIGGNEIEREILDALIHSYTSLFKVTSVSNERKLVLLKDLLNRRENIELIDIALSETAIPGMLLFMRLVSFTDFNMTSGITFAFPDHLEGYLVRRYKKLSKKVQSDSESIRRFVSFFFLSKTDGFKVKYEEKL